MTNFLETKIIAYLKEVNDFGVYPRIIDIAKNVYKIEEENNPIKYVGRVRNALISLSKKGIVEDTSIKISKNYKGYKLIEKEYEQK